MIKHTIFAGVAALALSTPAAARLQLTIDVGPATFTCFDGQLSCDLSGGARNLLVVDQTVGGAFVQLTLAQSSPDTLQLSSSNIENTLGVPLKVTLLASDTGFKAPTTFIESSASLTFNANLGAPDSTLSFFADASNAQGADPLNTPGALLESVSGHATADPDSFSGSRITAFDAAGPFSMTESAVLNLRPDGSVTGFNQSMTSGVPELSSWAMGILGVGFLTIVGAKRHRQSLAI